MNVGAYLAALADALAPAWSVAESAETARTLPAAVILPPTIAQRPTFGGLWAVELPVQFAVPATDDTAAAIADLLAAIDAAADAIETVGAAVERCDTFGAVTVAGEQGYACTARLTLDLTP